MSFLKTHPCFFLKKVNNINMKKIFTILFIIIFTIIFTHISALAETDVEGYWKNTKGLKVYIPPKNILTEPMTHAFWEWQKQTNNKITFDFVGTKTTSNIEVILLKKNVTDFCKNKKALGCTTTYGYPAPNTQKMVITKAKIYISEINNHGEVMSKTEVYTIMLHELGHALGLVHSKNVNSIMFPMTGATLSKIQDIQPIDIKDLYRIYNME